jgi:hypothetical protein
MDQIIDHLIQIVGPEWGTVKSHPEVFAAILALGLFFGWSFAWLILRNRLTHHKELVTTYEAIIAQKIPAKSISRVARSGVFSIWRMLFGAAVLSLCAGSALYLTLYLLPPNVRRPNIHFITASPLKIPGQPQTLINITLNNGANDLPAIALAGEFSGKITPTTAPLSPEEIRQKLDILNKKLEQKEMGPPPQAVLDNGTGWTITLPDLTTDDQELQGIMDQTSLLYVFFTLNYQDELTQKTGYWHLETCLYVLGVVIYYHQCGPNHPQFIKGSRYQRTGSQ